MTMTAETWKYVGSVTPAGPHPSDALDAVHTLGTKVTYYDATARTPGAGVAGTWNRKQVGGLTEAVFCNPVSNSHTVRWILAASASARTPTMITSPADTWATSTILFGFSRGGSTLNATGNGWDQTLPLDTGSLFSGYARALASSFVSTLTKVHLWECGSSFVLLFQTATAAVRLPAGLMLDPGVTNAGSPLSAEATSGGRYFFATNGTTTPDAAASWTTNPGTAVALTHTTSANGSHAFAVNIGLATLTAAERTFNTMLLSDTTTCITPDGDAVFPHILIGADLGGATFGRLREVCLGPDSIIPQTATSGGTVRAYGVSASPTAAADTFWLMA